MKKILLIMCIMLAAIAAKAQSASPVAKKYWSWMFPQYSMICPPFIEYEKKTEAYNSHHKQIIVYNMIPADSDSIHRIGFLCSMINIKYDAKGREIERNDGDKNGSSIGKSSYSQRSRTDSFCWSTYYKGQYVPTHNANGFEFDTYNRHGQLLSSTSINHDNRHNTYYYDITYFQYGPFHRLMNETSISFTDTIGTINKLPHPDYIFQYLYDIRGRLRLVLELDSVPGRRVKASWKLSCYLAFLHHWNNYDTARKQIASKLAHARLTGIYFYKGAKPVYHYCNSSDGYPLTECLTYDNKGRIAGQRCTCPNRRGCMGPPKIDTLYFTYYYRANGSIYALKRVPEKDSQYRDWGNCRMIQYFDEQGNIIREISYNSSGNLQRVDRYKYIDQ